MKLMEDARSNAAWLTCLATAFACLAAAAQMESFNTDYPGANGKLQSIDRASRTVRYESDWRGGSHYWFNFEARGFTGRWRFIGSRITKVGPAVSEDGGKSWYFLYPSADAQREIFDFDFGDVARPVRFALSIPYQLADWNRMADRIRGREGVKLGVLCKDRLGTPAPVLEICRSERPEWTFLFTARHHACECSASWVMEGLIDEVLSDTPEARWVRERARIVCVPFIDLDGVEQGEQGKSRKPHDHNRDYAQELYPTIKALKAYVKAHCMDGSLVFIDMHSPGVRGIEHDHYYGLGPAGEGPNRLWLAYSRELEKATRRARLRYDPQWDIPFGRPWNTAALFYSSNDLVKSDRYFASLPNCKLAFCMEYGYGLCGGIFCPEGANEVGRCTIKAVVRSLTGQSNAR